MKNFNLEHASWYKSLTEELKKDCIVDLQEIQKKREDDLVKKITKLKKVIADHEPNGNVYAKYGFNNGVDEVLALIQHE